MAVVGDGEVEVHSVLVILVAVATRAHAQLYYSRLPADEDFQVFWNVPSFQCHKHGLNFSSVSEEWGIRQNYQDQFRGEQIALLYDPGLFPALLPTTAGGHPQARNGGVPQEGDLSLHLDRFREDLTRLIPASTFSGVGVIDFEHWRPIWGQNWMSLSIYRNYSRYVERRRHPRWSKHDVEKEASERFEEAAKAFMLETLRLAKALRPKAVWGYYGYPFCFNYKPVGSSMPCSKEVGPENNRIKWLFEESTALYPSVYLRSEGMTEYNNAQYITSRVNEAIRMSKVAPKNNPVYVYIWSKYQDANRFLTKGDLSSSFGVPRRQGADGVIVWGASKDVNTKDKCLYMLNYLQTYLGPQAREGFDTPSQPQENNILSIFGR